MKYIISIIVLLIILVLALTVGANNEQIVEINYLFAQNEMRLSTLVALLFGLGFLFGWLATGYFYIKLRLKNMGLNRQVKKLQKELENNKLEQQQ